MRDPLRLTFNEPVPEAPDDARLQPIVELVKGTDPSPMNAQDRNSQKLRDILGLL
jgi:hypothetical protein